jgi:hypothetical protein
MGELLEFLGIANAGHDTPTFGMQRRHEGTPDT